MPSRSKNEILDKDVWAIIDRQFSEYGLIHHQIESYNEFILSGVSSIVSDNNIIEAEGFRVEFGEVVLQKPVHRELSEEVRSITPKECVDRDISYMAHLFVDIVVHPPSDGEGPQLDPRIHKKIHIGSIPVMVKSQLCNLFEIDNDPEELAALEEDLHDQGGYFIINGAQKIIASQQRTAYNTVYVFQNRKTQPKYEWYSEIRSATVNGAHSTITQVGLFKKRLISVIVPYIEMAAIPLGVMFRALGAKNEDDIIRHILPDTDDRQILGLLVASLEQSYECGSQEVALHYIGRRGKKFMGASSSKEEEEKDEDREEEEEIKTRADAISYARHLIATEFLPHLGVGPDSFIKKRFYLGYMVLRLLETYLGRRKSEDRDHYANKRIATAGTLINQLFFTAFKRFRSEISSAIVRCVQGSNAVNILSIIKPGTIKTIMCNALSNNNWGGRGKTQGVSQAYDHFNYAAGIANARKFVTPMSTEGGKIEGPRHLHNSHWMAVCPAETPEGKKCGLVTNAAMGCLVTTGSDPLEIQEIVSDMNIIFFEEMVDSPGEMLRLTKVFINGNPIGVTKNPGEIVNELRQLKRNGNLNPEISIAYEEAFREIRISTEAGRLCRPLFVVERGKILLKRSHIKKIRSGKWDVEPGSAWMKLLERGFIELVDKAEESSVLLVNYPSDLTKMDPSRRSRITHCEIHPSLMFGIGASLIPFPDHNQSPRNTYQCLWEEEPVLMGDGTHKLIKNVKVGDVVATFNPSTFKVTTTKVIHSHSAQTTKKIVRVRTKSGRQITVTEDHKMMTARGWVEAGKLKLSDRVAVWLKFLKEILCISVESITECENVRICDITTESDFHCFIGGDDFCVHNSAMGKQAIGVPGTNYNFQTKGTFHTINYPQKPIVSTKMSKIIGFDRQPAGQNAIVSVCPWYGYGQEDSIIMNQDSVDRGFMLITTRMSFDAKARRDKNEQFEVPIESDCSNYKGSPAHLDPITGIITEGTVVQEGDILIGRTVSVDESLTVHRKSKRNISILYDHPWAGTVHLVQKGIDGEGYEYVRVVVAQQRPPEIGDKFAARHGQKGTVGMKYRSYDLPYLASSGIAPDILVNPLALPSRMTIGMLVEMLCGRLISSASELHNIPVGKVFRLDDDSYENPPDRTDIVESAAAFTTKNFGDATPFENFSLKTVVEKLKELGINEFCDEEMINGQTGEPMRCLIFTGIAYYQRLRHMVIDKVHARSRGGRTRMTRQPREGRKLGGGFRVGHMERDCLVGQGAPWFAKDRLMEQSDETRIWFCKICGLQALVTAGDPKKRIPPRKECRVCESNQVALVKMPYATKLMMQELAGMNVVIRVLPTAYGEPGDAAVIKNGDKIIGKGTIIKS